MNSIQLFNTQPFINALKAFFAELNVPMDYITDLPARPVDILGEKYNAANEAHNLIDDVYTLGLVNDAIFDHGKQTNIQLDQIRNIKEDYQGLIVFGVTLKSRDNGLLPTRSQLSDIARAFNRVFHYTPVVVVFKYDNYISLANCERIKYKNTSNEGEKAGKVSLLRDINTENIHRGHSDILKSLEINRTGKSAVNSFDALYKYWQEVFNINLLNKKFYKELQNWYFWAIKEVTFPNTPKRIDFEDDVKFDEAVREHKGKNVIRLLTRILFIWFIKERKLIPEQLFDENFIADKLIKNFTPQKPQGIFATGKHSSPYYRAILQNLFFATLNQEMGKRAFRIDGGNMNVTNLMRYKNYFKNPDIFVTLMEEVVPFMNGGLFECLDKPHPIIKSKNGGDIIIYNDGFSDRDDNEVSVPDYLFFDLDEEVDLSENFEDKSDKKTYKNSKTRGLLEILKSYKFTITENTPIEEDVALDPELLGKVFENLLASYNPETKTTARKQTGSFYTPREIVNYMVDESLIAYLKTKLENLQLPDEQLDIDLHQLLSYDTTNPYEGNAEVQSQLIGALDQCSILDPACGSGAFPMGILQKMVHVLHKIDPNNNEWKQRQINRVNKAIESLEEIDDEKFREQSIKELKAQIKDVEESFSNNELDYGRKLFLIENCIYGVDIQPIATQISKLRFFISLIVDQKIDKTKPNFGIRPLPNLETKFVTANTLIGIEKPNAQLSLLDKPEIKKLEAELKMVRHKLFSTKTPSVKRNLREQDKNLRDQIAELLIEDGWGNDTARQLAEWDPYDQNASSSFFDSEWMFDKKEGFDVVIGNPPYGIVKSTNTNKLVLGKYQKYFSADFKVNLFALFLEKGLIISNSTGVNSFIIPDSSLNLPAFKKLRLFILNNSGLNHISHFNETVFESAEVGKSVILQYTKNLKVNSFKFRSFDKIHQYIESSIDLFRVESDTELKFVYNTDNKMYEQILNKIKSVDTKLKDYCDVYDGINPGSQEIKNTVITIDKIDNDSKKIIDGKSFSRYSGINWSGDYIYYNIDFIERLRRKIVQRGESFTGRIIKKTNFFIHKKIVTRQTADSIIGTIDTEKYFVKNSVHSTLIKSDFKDKISLELILGIINSKLIDWFYRIESLESGRLFPQVKIERLINLPISLPANNNLIYIIENNVKKLILNNLRNDEYEMIQNQINELVYKLYYLTYAEVQVVEDGKFWLSEEDYAKISVE